MLVKSSLSAPLHRKLKSGANEGKNLDLTQGHLPLASELVPVTPPRRCDDLVVMADFSVPYSVGDIYKDGREDS